jgi:5-deoxy-glucuronate isomerase
MCLKDVKMNVATQDTNLIFRRTNANVGRHIAISPTNSPMQHLAYGRIVLNSIQPSARIAAGDRETGLFCLAGEAQISVAGTTTHLSHLDALYIPRDTEIEVATESSADLAEISADVTHRYPLQVVRHQDIVNNPGLHLTPGGPSSTRRVHLMLAKNIEAGRLMAGYTYSEPGNWTSWPPHEHAALAEEMYIYFDMPSPAFGIQLVYSDANEPEVATIVHDGDAVLIPTGYHPNVSVPGHRIAFLWAMAAHQEGEGRQYGVVNFQPEFYTGPTGLEAGRK